MKSKVIRLTLNGQRGKKGFHSVVGVFGEYGDVAERPERHDCGRVERVGVVVVLDEVRCVDGQYEVRQPLTHGRETGGFAEVGRFDGAEIWKLVFLQILFS